MRSLTYLRALALHHVGECILLGMSADRTLYIEEHSDDALITRRAQTLTGTILAEADESRIADFVMPDRMARPRSAWGTMRLNFAGARHRGDRAQERVDDLVRPIPLADKAAILDRLGSDLPAPLLIGLAESYVLSESLIAPPHLFIVCRRLRLAYALTTPRIEPDGTRCTYDTLTLHSAHWFDRAADEPPGVLASTNRFEGVAMTRPIECLYAFDHLAIVDAGDGTTPGAIHLWQVEPDPDAQLSDEEKWDKKLYG